MLDAAIDDVALAIRQKHDLRGFCEGKRTGGNGIHVNRKRAKQHVADMKRAEACARQLQAGFESHTGPTYIPNSGIHRPKGKPKTSRTINAGKPKKSRVMNGGKLLRNVIHSGNTLLLCKRQLAMALRSVRKRSVRLPPEPDKEVEVEPEDRLSDRRALNCR